MISTKWPFLDGYQLEMPKLKIQPPHRLSSRAGVKVSSHLKGKKGKVCSEGKPIFLGCRLGG